MSRAIGGGRQVPRPPLGKRRRVAGVTGAFGSVASVTSAAGDGGGTSTGGGGGGTIIDDPEPTTDLRCTEDGETRITEGSVERRIDG